MIHELNINSKKYLLIEVNDEVFELSKDSVHYPDHYIDNDNFFGKRLVIMYGKKGTLDKEIDLPKENNYKDIGFISKLTEEECESLVIEDLDTPNPLDRRYYNYEVEAFDENNLEFTSKESFISLLKSKGVLAKSFVDFPLQMFYTPEYDCQKYPSECYEEDYKQYKKIPQELLLIEVI
jgi:hypothetical protein